MKKANILLGLLILTISCSPAATTRNVKSSSEELKIQGSILLVVTGEETEKSAIMERALQKIFQEKGIEIKIGIKERDIKKSSISKILFVSPIDSHFIYIGRPASSKKSKRTYALAVSNVKRSKVIWQGMVDVTGPGFSKEKNYLNSLADEILTSRQVN